MDATHFEFDAIGTHWEIDIADKLSSERKAVILERIQKRIDDFDRHYSRFRSDSLVSEMARRADIYQLPEDAHPLLDLYQQLSSLTDGLFTPLIGQIMVDAGYDADYSLHQQRPLTSPKKWDDVLSFSGSRLTVKQPALLDFGAGGKGYLVDLIGELLHQQGIPAYTIDAGGDILHHSDTALKVGLENPANTKQVIGISTIAHQSICGSAGNRRSWQDFHHIINPHTLHSPRHILATWVVAKTALLADALATALYFKPAAVFRDYYDFEYLILSSEFKVEKSAGFPAEVFTI